MENPCCQCLGTGKIMCPVCLGAGRLIWTSLFEEACPKCKETGQIPCLECKGLGVSPYLATDDPPHHIAISSSP